ncbi:MAG: translation initiation factor IF-3 [bacterium]|nr:translation initiation factor IF-3 [bacterium]
MRRGFWQKKVVVEKRPKANLQIKAPQVRVIDDNGEQLGVLSTTEAIRLAHQKGMDLIEVNPQADPPIAKILDYGKYMYRKEKGNRGNKNKKAAIQEVKTVRIGLKTGDHDLQVKSQLADKFLTKGHKVRLEILLRGREKAFKDLAKQKLQSFLGYITAEHVIEENVKFTPGGFSAIVRPGK